MIDDIQQEEVELLQVRRQRNVQDVTDFNRLTLVVFTSMAGFTLLLLMTTRRIFVQSEEKNLRANELTIANKALYFENDEKVKRADELVVANKELTYQNKEKGKRAAELVIAGKELVFQKREKKKRAAELLLADIELVYQTQEKEDRAAELVVANIELSFQNTEKEKRADELIVANEELSYQSDEKEKRAAELVIANIELSFQNEEKEKRAYELMIANRELVFQNQEKEKRAAELIIANKELIFQNEEKEKRASELKDTISLLNVSQAFNHGVLNSLSSHIAVMDRSGKLIAVNDSWNRFAADNGDTSLQRTSIGSNYFDVCTSAVANGDEIAGEAMQGIKDVLNEVTPVFYIEYPCHSPDEYRWFGMRAIKFEGEDSLVVVSHINVTERRLAEQNLLISEASLKEAQSIAHIGNYEVDLITGIHIWSDEMFAIFGITKALAIPSRETFLSFVHPANLQMVTDNLALSLKTLQIADLEFCFIKIDGSLRYGRTESQFGLDAKNKPIRLFGIFQDVTDRKLAELERTVMVNDLIKRNKDLEQFAYIVSHNFRSPIANILGASEALKDTELTQEDKLILKKGINTSVLKLDTVVKDLNHILETRASISEQKEMVKFGVLVDDIKNSIQNMIDKHNITISYDFSAVGEMFSLKPYLYSIFYNLISNSIKYRQIDVPAIISIQSLKTDKGTELIFTDNGMGIDLLKKGNDVFGMYKRFHENVEGKGLGLFMVKTQVEALHGRINVKSSINQGSTFSIAFSNQQPVVVQKLSIPQV